ncbi:MAG: glycoside hydrolase family 2 TIM barrel-domain containing protein [Bacteroidales bacterium]|nr:glycoside hydrolase family 2 TIM barrel-domain containing protein [Bacteroidales bacterium]
MKFSSFFLMALMALSPSLLCAQRSEQDLTHGWRFHQGAAEGAESPDFNDQNWQSVNVPHDWAITGPFSRDHDLQKVAVTQNFETEASVKTGRTGGLPYVGEGWYRTSFRSTAGKHVSLVFEGAMSEAKVYVNGTQAIFWPYGYNAFHCDVTSLLRPNGEANVLAVHLENKPQSSRWYPGAGLFRHVKVVETERVHIPVWGTQVTTPHVAADYASVCLRTTIEGADTCLLTLKTYIVDENGKTVASKTNRGYLNHGQPFEQHLTVERPRLWSPETPHRYRAVTEVSVGGKVTDRYETPFGIRSIEFVADKGFYLNGERRKFQGVCLHHDLGPLGAAVNRSAIRHQLRMLKDMGCDAVRTSHNMPAPELVELCDEMGFMMMLEPFDEWDIAKCDNGYHRYFAEWAERDMVNMLRQFRNHPSVVMWSIGNEVPTQCSSEGYKVATFLRDICHREDPTRPVTCGMDQVSCVLDNGFAAMLDVPGFNYRAHRYEEAYERLPQNLVLGSETSSTVSSRGVYHFPVEKKADVITADHQSSSYDLEYCSWSNIPDVDLALAEDHEWTLGQFVWTGFDYLGEPSPYDTDAWPNHSSMFGIIDLASIPKDRFYLYRSVWNKKQPTLWALPHWTWQGREGEVTPVFVYTSHPSAELFINGKSQGRLSKKNRQTAKTVEERYRLMWNDVVYEPGTLKVVAYDAAGNKADSLTVKTAGKPHHLVIEPSFTETLAADGKDIGYYLVKAVDKEGNLCPHFSGQVELEAKGAACFKAVANGDATSLELFHLPRMHAFGGQLMMLVQAGSQAGTAQLRAKAKGLRPATLSVEVK